MASKARPKSSRARKHRGRELISRIGEVTDWGGGLFVYAESRTADGEGRRSLPTIDLRGTLDKPVKGATAFELGLIPCEKEPDPGNAEIPCVGVVLAAKPAMRCSVYLSRIEFDLVAALALGGKLRQISLTLQEPQYGHALIAGVGFSSEPME